jgi:hypothetical protein
VAPVGWTKQPEPVDASAATDTLDFRQRWSRGGSTVILTMLGAIAVAPRTRMFESRGAEASLAAAPAAAGRAAAAPSAAPSSTPLHCCRPTDGGPSSSASAAPLGAGSATACAGPLVSARCGRLCTGPLATRPAAQPAPIRAISRRLSWTTGRAHHDIWPRSRGPRRSTAAPATRQLPLLPWHCPRPGSRRRGQIWICFAGRIS